MIINTLHKEDAPQKVCAEKAGCSESAILKHINGKLTKKMVEKKWQQPRVYHQEKLHELHEFVIYRY